jgi:hypothetical protein
MDVISVVWIADLVDGAGCGAIVRRIYEATDQCGNIARCVQFIERERIELSAQVILGGPYLPGPDTMRTTINSLLPNTQPYSAPPYNYGGSEFLPVLPAHIVDWVLVEIREAADVDVVVAQRAALLTSEGLVVDLDGVSPVTFYAPNANYYVSIRHRNHLDIVSNATIDFTAGSGMADFTAAGISSGTVLNSDSGRYIMIKGDVTGDHQVKYNGSGNDRNAVLSVVGTLTPNNVLSNIYHVADVNMDGTVKYNGSANDKNEILNSVGLTTPNNIMVGQLF